MASLIENLIDVLDRENSEYEILLELSMKKTPVIIAGAVEELQKITDEEQAVVSRITSLDKKREEVIGDIANVINKDVTTLKLKNLIQMLAKSQKEQQQLAVIHDKLQGTIAGLVKVNEQNRELLEKAMELVAFDMNILQAMKTAPETANYNKGAYNAGNVLGSSRGMFDAKQ